MKQIISLAICCMFLGTTLLASTQPHTTNPHKGYHVGDKAEDFSLMNVDGKMVSLADYPEAKGFVIVFTCNHCPYAVMYEDRLVELQKTLAPKGYQIIAINPNDPEVREADGFDEMKVRAKEKGFQFPYLFDDGQKIFPKFGATKTPHVYVLDSEHVVRYIGAIDDNAKEPEMVEVKYVENAVEAITTGGKVDPSFTKAIGCSIKVKKTKEAKM